MSEYTREQIAEKNETEGFEGRHPPGPTEAEAPNSGENVNAVAPVEPPTEGELTESKELTAGMSLEFTTAKAETEALMAAIKEVCDAVEAMEGQEGTSKVVKAMLLGLRAQRSISQVANVEMKQIAVKQLDLLRHVATGFQEQSDHLQQISDDIGAGLNSLAQGFVKLSQVIQDGHSKSKNEGTEVENRHRQVIEKLDSQNQYFLHIRNGVNATAKEVKNLSWTAEELRTGGSHGKTGEVTAKHGSLLATLNRNLAEILENYPQNLAAMTDEIQKSLKALETVMKEGLEKKKRPAEGPPPEPKKVKFHHPGTNEEFMGTEKERDQKMAQWWSEIAANSASSGSNVTGNPGTGNPLRPMTYSTTWDGATAGYTHDPDAYADWQCGWSSSYATVWLPAATTWILLSASCGGSASTEHASSACSNSVKMWMKSFDLLRFVLRFGSVRL